MRKTLAILIGLLMFIGAIAGLGSSSLQKPTGGVGTSSAGQVMLNVGGAVSGDSQLTFNPSTGVLSATGGLFGGDVPGENAMTLYGNHGTAFDCSGNETPASDDNSIFQDGDNVIRNCYDTGISTSLGWVLLDEEIITSAQETIQLNYIAWPDKFDTIIVQFINVIPTTSGRFRIKNLIETASSASNTIHNAITLSANIIAVCEAATTVTHLVTCFSSIFETGSGFNAHALELAEGGSTLSGDLVAHRQGSFEHYSGVMSVGYIDSVDSEPVGYISTIKSTAIGADGFEFSMSGSITMKGTFRLWGRTAR